MYNAALIISYFMFSLAVAFIGVFDEAEMSLLRVSFVNCEMCSHLETFPRD